MDNTEQLIKEVFSLIDEHIKHNKIALDTVGREKSYWYGRLFESEDFKREFGQLIKKYN